MANSSQVVGQSGVEPGFGGRERHTRNIESGLLGELKASTVKIERKLDEASAKKDPIQKISNDEKTFRFLLNEDAMATEKLAEGIRLFAADIVKLEKKILSKL